MPGGGKRGRVWAGLKADLSGRTQALVFREKKQKASSAAVAVLSGERATVEFMVVLEKGLLA